MASVNRSQDHRDAKELPAPGVGNYIVGAEIGRGSFATVYKGYHKKTHKHVAIKSVLRSKLTKKLLENLESEITILKSIRHDHIVQLVDCQKSDTHIHLIMEYCSMGDLSHFIKRRDSNSSNAVTSGASPSRTSTHGGLSEHIVRHFLKQLANALEFLRSKNLIHRDIKPQNLLLLPPHPDKQRGSSVGLPDLPVLKIADFGFARSLPSTSLAETLCGSPLYMAPEILRYEKYDAKADLWSVGAVLYEMSVGKPPFRAQNHVDLLRKIEKGGDRIKFPGESTGVVHTGGGAQLDSDKLLLNNKASSPNASVISEELKDLIRHLLKRNPVERISFEEFFMHPCVAGEVVQPNPLPRTSSKEKISQETRVRDTSDAHTSNAQDNDNSKRHVRDRSISSPIPDFEESAKDVLSGEYPILLQRKISKDNVRQQSFQRFTKYSNNIPGIVYPQFDKFDKMNDNIQKHYNNNTQVHADLQPSYENPSPPPSLLVQQPYAQDDGSKSIDGHPRRSSNADEEILFEREYVVVESRRAVEVNKLADELAASPKSAGLIQRHSNKGNAIIHTGVIPATNPLDLQYRTPNPNTSASFFYSTAPPFALPPHERVGSAGSTGSASSALAKALSVASTRLFGTGNSPPSWSDKYSKQKGNAITFPSDTTVDPAEEAVIKVIEDHACKAYVVYQYADTKVNQLLPPPPTASNDLVDGQTITPESAAVMAQEAFVLYLKSLSLLQSAMDNAKEYWTRLGEPQSNYSSDKSPSFRFNNAVQWVRARFNECLEKAEYAKSRCPTEEEMGANSCVVEKLLYDRALEMSRQAAVNELVGEDLPGCERAYKAAIHMLDAILESPIEDGDAMDEDDRRIVNKFIVSISNRVNSLQKKIVAS